MVNHPEFIEGQASKENDPELVEGPFFIFKPSKLVGCNFSVCPGYFVYIAQARTGRHYVG